MTFESAYFTWVQRSSLAIITRACGGEPGDKTIYSWPLCLTTAGGHLVLDIPGSVGIFESVEGLHEIPVRGTDTRHH